MPPPNRDSRAHWNERYRVQGPILADPSPFLTSFAGRLPPPGRALDVAGGRGRNALWLAAQGWEVTLVDVAEVGLALAREAAAAQGLPLRTEQRDLEQQGLPPGRFDLIVSIHFLHRPLFSHWGDALTPGGLLLFEQPTYANLERHTTPSARFLLEDGELPTLLEGLKVLSYEEGWTESGRHEARLIAQRPPES
jgi:tellurite methyltransferase